VRCNVTDGIKHGKREVVHVIKSGHGDAVTSGLYIK